MSVQKNLLLLNLIFNFSIATSSAMAQLNGTEVTSKKVICTATINSPDEVDVMKQRFAGQNVEFVELVPEGVKLDPNYNDNEGRVWMKEACQRGIQCDVLLISGHFAGTFLGDVGKQSLSTRALMDMSCDPACSGILKKPTEVYLMGCNTLKGKAVNETRTPEQYLVHLVNHGYSPEDARRATVMTFSSIGATNKTQMERIFSDTPKIYGFNNLAPRGADIRSSWDNYIRSITDIDLHLQRMRAGERNTALVSALSWTAITGTQGVKLNPIAIFDQQRSCAVASSNYSLENRLKALLEILGQDNRMDYFLEFSSLILQTYNKSLKSKERSLLKQLQRHEGLRADLMAARAALDYNLTLQFQVSDSQFLLGHLSQSQAVKFMSTRITQELNEKKLAELEAQDICRIVKSRQIELPSKQNLMFLSGGMVTTTRFNEFCRSRGLR